MKAIRIEQFGGPEVLKLQDVPDPTPGPGQVVVKVSAIGVNPVETYIRAGNYGPRQFPFTPGADAAGVIESVAPDVTAFKPGDRVYTYGSLSGTYAEKTLCTQDQVHPLPQKIGFDQGAAMGVPYGTACYALFHRAHVQAGEWLLVHGASGGVGTAALQLARAAGVNIVGTAGSDAGLQLVRSEGAHHAFNHHAPGYLPQAVKVTEGGKGFDAILEMLANVNLDHDLDALALGGRVIVIGSRARIEIDPRKTMGKGTDIRGMSLMNATPKQLASIHAALYAGLENNTLRPVIQSRLPLADAAKAHELVLKGDSHGKIVLTV
jgi:NADPH2:quinone reductase